MRCCWFLEKKLGFSLVGFKSKDLNREIHCCNLPVLHSAGINYSVGVYPQWGTSVRMQ